MYRKLLTRQAMVYGFLLSYCSLYAQSPGGIARQSIWLQGNSFYDSSQTWTLNFNPASNMDGISNRINMPGKIEDLKRATIFTVYQNPGLEQDRPVWQINGGFSDLLLSTRQVSSKSGKMNMFFEKPETRSIKPQRTETIISTYLRRVSSQPISENLENKEVLIQFGNPASHTMAGQSPGLISEFIVYKTILKEKEISRIETYLAIKYGITLEKNYLNSLGETIWSWEKEALYSNNIAGIGRDDHSALYQKQSTSCNASEQLTIGTNKIVHSNAQNTGQLNDRDYLIWGDNGHAFTFSGNANPGVNDLLLSEKKWLMKSSGSTTNTIITELRIDTKTLLPTLYPKENFYLVIDHSGSGDFVPKNCSFIIPDSISSEGIANFSRVHWDTDGSGKDVFSFGLKMSLTVNLPSNPDAAKLLSFHVYPNPFTGGNYNIAVTLDKPADISIKVYDLHLHLIDSKMATGQANYFLPGKINAASGTYIVRLFTAGKEISQIIIRQ